MRQGIVGEHHLEDQRGAAKDHGVAARKRSRQPKPTELHPGENEAEDQSAAEPKGSNLERQFNALKQVRQTEVVQEQRHQTATSINREDVGFLEVVDVELPLLEQVHVNAGLLDFDQRGHDRIPEFRLVLGDRNADRIRDRHRNGFL